MLDEGGAEFPSPTFDEETPKDGSTDFSSGAFEEDNKLREDEETGFFDSTVSDTNDEGKRRR